ncbi:type VII toxin-antitoxin system MntA family adenylyltransferase antitoxin [Halorientalis pallida]|uniref:type VII toxin-antitoxin system MntA family adenylyltransferase antitoxin n=1 Tax=Halorientalis pallida TaxID=2479928 RepID=UPI003C704C50
MRTVESASVDTSLDLDTLRAVLRAHPVKLAILFGSHATGTAHEASDIDIAVEFSDQRPADPNYNDTFFGLSADLSETLETDAVDLVDVRTVSPDLATAIFENGVLLVGEHEHAVELRRQVTQSESDARSPRERLDAAVARIDDHLDTDDTEVSATGGSAEER